MSPPLLLSLLPASREKRPVERRMEEATSSSSACAVSLAPWGTRALDEDGRREKGGGSPFISAGTGWDEGGEGEEGDGSLLPLLSSRRWCGKGEDCCPSPPSPGIPKKGRRTNNYAQRPLRPSPLHPFSRGGSNGKLIPAAAAGPLCACAERVRTSGCKDNVKKIFSFLGLLFQLFSSQPLTKYASEGGVRWRRPYQSRLSRPSY